MSHESDLDELDELSAIQGAVKVLAPLGDEGLAGAMQWLNHWARRRLSQSSCSSGQELLADSATSRSDDLTKAEGREWSSAADLLAATGCGTEHERVLVVGYWYQVCEEYQDLESQSINSELKHLGHAVGNITRAIGRLTNRKPQLMVQTRKEGKAKQARKKFKLTHAGIEHVESMFRSPAEQE